MTEADGEPTFDGRLARSAKRLAGGAANVTTALAGLALIALVGYWSYTTFLHLPEDTYGQLLVDSPEIYTRERLVNDRFVEDAWLRRKLRDTGSVDFGPTGSAFQYQETSTQIQGGSVSASSDEAALADDGGTTSSNAGSVTLPRPAAASLRSELDFRREVRNLIIENQLDDRHDLRGNSLYRLKFDASVLPGKNTRANALISVTLEEPERKPLADDDLFFTRFDRAELAKWRKLYENWLSSIDENIDQSLRDLKDDYRNGRFTIEYYRDMIDIMAKISIDCNPGVEEDFRDLNSLTEQEEPDFAAIKLALEMGREKIKRWANCVVPKGRQISPTPVRNTPSHVSEAMLAVHQAKGAKTRTDQPDAAEPLQPGAGGPAEASTASARIKPTTIQKRQAPRLKEKGVELLPKGQSIRGMPRDSLINRLAGPKLSQLAFGSSRTGRTAAGTTDRWDIFFPFAIVLASYEESPPFTLSAHETTLQLRPAFDPCTLKETLIAWSELGALCLNKKFGRAADTLEELNINLDQLANSLKMDPAIQEKIDSFFDDENNDASPIQVRFEAGLFAFIRELQKSRSVFSYAVTPKQSVQTLEVDERMMQSASATGGWRGIMANFSGEQGAAFKGTRDQPLVVGFGNALHEISGGDAERCDPSIIANESEEISCPVRIEFGWFISPPVQGTDSQGLNKVHAAAQYALTALVSVPAWWDSINLKVEKAWLDEDGVWLLDADGAWRNENDRIISATNEEPYPSPDTEIDLPSDLESITLLLLDRGAGPEIEENRMDPIVVTACRPASVLLPGRRLWRSAVVTLGSQVADEIQVLPNMRGIIAKFDQVEVPSGWPQLEPTGADDAPVDPALIAPVTVWTSEGSSTLRRRASIHVPFAGLDANGTCAVVANR